MRDFGALARELFDGGLTVSDWCGANGARAGEVTLGLVDALADDPFLAGYVCGTCAPHAAALVERAGEEAARRLLLTTAALYLLTYRPGADVCPKVFRAVARAFPAGVRADDLDAALLLGVARAPAKADRTMTCGGFARYLCVVGARLGCLPLGRLAEWFRANGAELCDVIPNRASRWTVDALLGDGYPTFDLVRAWNGNGYSVRVVRFDTDSRFCRDLMRRAAATDERGPAVCCLIDPFFQEFTASIGFTPTSLDDFTVEVLDRQVRWFSGRENAYSDESPIRFLRRFYISLFDVLPEDQGNFTFATGFVPAMIHHHNVFDLWLMGYRAVVHNPLDPPPAFPRWLLFPSEDELASTHLRPNPWAVDFSFDDPGIQRLVIDWVWRECENVAAMRRTPGLFRRFFATVAEDGPVDEVGAGAVGRHLAKRADEVGASTLRHDKAWLRSLLHHGEELGVLSVDPACYMILGTSEKGRRWAPDEGAAVPMEDLARVLEHLEATADESPFDQLVHIALCTQALTPLRIGDILTLRRGDLERGAGGAVRAVRVSTKTDGYWRRAVQLPANVGRMLGALADATEGLSREAGPGLAPYVFLYRSHARLSIKLARTYDVTCRVKAACEAVGVPAFTPRNVRRRYETEVVLRGIRRNISRLALRPLTGHRDPAVTERYYVRDDVRDYLEAVHGIEIGDPPGKGEVLSDGAVGLGAADAVEGGAGYCRNDACDIAGTVTCLMCSGFVTTPACIPEMEEAVAVVDAQIKACGANQHEREHLMSVKRLYLGYLAVMRTMDAEARDGS